VFSIRNKGRTVCALFTVHQKCLQRVFKRLGTENSLGFRIRRSRRNRGLFGMARGKVGMLLACNPRVQYLQQILIQMVEERDVKSNYGSHRIVAKLAWPSDDQ